MSPFAHFSSGGFANALLAACALASPNALALQPLSEFLAGARRASVDQRIADLQVVQQEAESLAALGREIPSLSARGVYTRNQYQSVINAASFGVPGLPVGKPLVIQPYNQLDGYLELDVPIIDVAGWARVRAQHATERASRQSAKATFLTVQAQVARAYYQLVGAEALKASAERSLKTNQDALALTRERLAGGVATALDVDRATAEVERARQRVSDAELNIALSSRTLETLTGVAPEGPAEVAPDDLQEEPPLEGWQREAAATSPTLLNALEQRRSAEELEMASKLSLAPLISASGQEHWTNASGFTGQNNLYVLNATLTWKLDLVAFGNIRSQAAGTAIARAREEGTRRSVLDQVHEAWFRVHDGIAKSRAAQAQAKAAASAAARAEDRYREGAGTHLELIQAERDAFDAEVSRIQADADLSYARAYLRLQAGRPLGEAKPSREPSHEP